jgi:hypothetical protein
LISTLIVGDVHGCADELETLTRAAQAARVVLVGDLYTKGPDPVGVYRQICAGGFQAVLGNHDQRLLDVCEGGRAHDEHAQGVVAALDRACDGWRAHLAQLPLTIDVAGWTVVHAGLHPSGQIEQTTRAMALSMRQWPPGQRDAPRWHTVYAGERRVVFGHDAIGGLVRVERDGGPWVVGLDSGCVYGGQLSGYLVEQDRLLQVPAARVYQPVT